MIIASQISKSYGDSLVVDGVSVSIPAGGVTSIIGPNGAGKSTLLSIVARLMSMDAGTVTVDGLDVTKTPSDTLAKRLSILRQDNHISSRLTVRDLVGFGRYPYSKGRPTIEDKVHIDRALEYLHLEALAGRFLDELSGGQRQRAFVAMVLCQDTDYVLLDEPLNNLDMKHAVQMMKHLRRAAEELGRTIVIVLHDINFAGHYADHICAMKDGEVVEFGPPSAIMTGEVLTRVFDTSVQVVEGPSGPLAVYY